MNQLLDLSAEVREALAQDQPIVALESTVISHGLPRPMNLETALRLEQIVRENGAVPATCAVLQGRLRVGLNREELEHFANADGIKKLSRRDLPVAVANGWDGATTVATTMILASMAGISVFATGGIGGVHRGALPDVSADLPELARTSMIVVCSGGKIILDLPATREWLETHGVTVLGYGCDEMPAFYSQKSGLPIDARADTPAQVAAIFNARHKLGLDGATLVTVPVPREAEVPPALLQDALQRALSDADAQNITGRELTPFLLSRMAEESQGATLTANLALLENNARAAAQIACALKPAEARA